MHSNQAMPPPPLHPQLLDALSSVQQNFETQLKTRNRRSNDQCPCTTSQLERRWKLAHYLHLNAVVVRSLMFLLVTGYVLVIFS